jgi:DNA (cytosine-5)-methyltransferase 1
LKNQNQITLGSLFDGIGGFPYAGSFFGIKPLWASEILPQAISVTKRHLPEMEHVGDITALDGAKLPPVDIITFGSPCQDLSVAGRRAGLSGERSGLFAEAIRIIDEMRKATNGKYPRYAIWENVPGALSSSSCLDFKAVLEAFTKTEIPMPLSGRWANAGMVRRGGADLAWCVYNAQYFGVPQRRRRIFLVCDFGGGCAGEILFIPKSLPGYFAARRAQGQIAAADAERCAGSASLPGNIKDKAATLFAGYGKHWNGNAGAYDGGNFALSPQPNCRTPDEGVTAFAANQRDEVRDLHDISAAVCASQTMKQQTLIAQSANCLTPWDNQQERVFTGESLAPALAGADGGVVPAAFIGGAGAKARSIGYSEEVSPTLKSEAPPSVCEPKIARTLTARGDGSPNIDGGPNIVAVGVHQGQGGDVNISENAYALTTNSGASSRNAPLVAFSLSSAESNSMKSANPKAGCHETETARTLDTSFPCPSKNQGGIAVVSVHPDVTGTLVASGAGLSRTGGLASETDLCVAYALQGNMIGRKDENGPRGGGVSENLSYTLTSTDTPAVASVDCRNLCETGELSGTLQSKPQGYSLNYQNPIRSGYIVRRLLPVECERLQGYPDGWTESGHDGKPVSDTRRYQMLGNSVAVPCVAYILMSVAEEMNKFKEAV